MAVLAPPGRWQRAHWVPALPVGTGPRSRSGRGRARQATAIAPLARPARPAAAGLGQGPFSSGPGPGMPAWHWHWQGEGLMVSANLKRRATRAARVQLDAYQKPRAASSSDHIVPCRQATCYWVGSLAPLISAPAAIRTCVRMHRRRAQSIQNGARCVPHRCAARYPSKLTARYPRRHGIPARHGIPGGTISQPAWYPTLWRWMRTS